MAITQQYIENQFVIDLSHPNPNKEFNISCNKEIKVTGLTLLMKYVLLSKKYPHLLHALLTDTIIKKKYK